MSELGYVQEAQQIETVTTNEFKTKQLDLKNAVDEKISLIAPTSVPTNYSVELPATETAGALNSDGAGTASWGAAGPPSGLTDYEEFTDTDVWVPYTGGGAGGIARYTRIGQMVFLSVSPNTQLASDIARLTVPARFRPASNNYEFVTTVNDNGTEGLGVISFAGSSDLLNISSGIAAGIFGVSGNSTNQINISWNINI